LFRSFGWLAFGEGQKRKVRCHAGEKAVVNTRKEKVQEKGRLIMVWSTIRLNGGSATTNSY